MDNFVVISGCSGGGKSTLLAELARRGHAVVEEPGRRIVREELASGGSALPWLDTTAFIRRAIAMALADRAAATDQTSWVFFDRGLIDAAAGLEILTGEPAAPLRQTHRYHRHTRPHAGTAGERPARAGRGQATRTLCRYRRAGRAIRAQWQGGQPHHPRLQRS